MDTQNTFGPWLKQRRKQLDLTQDELAALVSCSPVTIRKIEANQRRPSKQVAVALAQALQVDPLEIARFLAEARGITPQALIPSPFLERHMPLSDVSLVKRPAEIAAVCGLLRRAWQSR